MNVAEQTLSIMRDYYQARASEYDDWWQRRGRYDLGEAGNGRWQREAAQVVDALEAHDLSGHVLELAPGTGNWTERLVQTAEAVTAVDASSEMIAINRAKLAREGVDSERVNYVQADLFTWQPDRSYDAVFFGFWLSHVPLERMGDFLSTVAAALVPGGKLFFVDSQRHQPQVHHQGEAVTTPQLTQRQLDDGREFVIVKNFFAPEALIARFQAAGLDVAVQETATHFIFGAGTRS